ncbi:Kelch-like protein 9 [Rhizophlyctis rosea]|nr:Kelch-like protein 9 [Rhizophlyctis rosea]
MVLNRIAHTKGPMAKSLERVDNCLKDLLLANERALLQVVVERKEVMDVRKGFEKKKKELESEEHDRQITDLGNKKRDWDKALRGEQQRDSDHISFDGSGGGAQTQVDIKIGGKHFCVSEGTLVKQQGTIFDNLLEKDSANSLQTCTIFIDRDGTCYNYIFNFLRDGDGAVLPSDSEKRQRLLQEARYCGIKALERKLKEEDEAAKKQFDVSWRTLERGGRSSLRLRSLHGN